MKIELFGDKDKNTPSKVILDSINNFSRKKQLRHQLWLLSCYVNFDIIKKLVKRLKNEIKLTDVFLVFNFSEIFNSSPKKTKEKLDSIEKWCSKNKINFEWAAVSHNNLIHAKGYAIIQYKKDEINDGLVLITSGNLTKNGFYGKNIEIGFSTNNIEQLEKFTSIYNHLWKNYNKDIEEKILDEENHIFKYSLLSSGLLLHKWSNNLKQELGIKYKLTKYAKLQVNISEELAEFGIDTGDSFSLQIINTSNLPKKDIPSHFTRLYTVDTYWGRWCTKEIWDEVKENLKGSSNFLKSFKKLTNDEMLSQYRFEAIDKQQRLYDLKYIKRNEISHIDTWIKRIIDLRENTKKLERIFTGYEANPIPYNYENHKEINNLFKSMIETISFSKKPNLISKKITKARESCDFGELSLNSEEKKSLKKVFKNT
jgi:hypothetical protein